MTTAQALQLALEHHRAGRRAAAEDLCRRILEREPNHAGALHLLGLMAQGQGRLPVAEQLMRMAIAADPGVAEYGNNLGAVLGAMGRLDHAIDCFREALRLRPAYGDALRNLGAALARAGRLEEAVAPLREAVRLGPADAATRRELVALHHGRGDLGAAIEERRALVEALAGSPEQHREHSDLLLTLHYSDEYTPEQLFQEHLEWARRYEAPLLQQPAPAFANARDPDRPLRLGYVSPDFRDHPHARFALPLLRAHDRERVEVFCYSDVARPDAVTEVFRSAADVWREVTALSDEAMAEQIRRDGVDVLVDLAGHMDSRRMLAFARRPAPVQAEYLGYPNSTGTQSIGYRISDEITDPPGEADRLHTETLIRLPGCPWCYDPGPEQEVPEVTPLPALREGFVRFGVMNRLAKATPRMARLWAEILGRVPGSRLAVLGPHGMPEANVRAAYARPGEGGIDPARLDVLPPRPRRGYLEHFNGIDVLLDPLPYNGMTSTCDGLWMGVPAVTLAGDRHVSRVGASLLAAVGLPELVARTPQEYADTAVRLASDLPGLAGLRSTLRGRMAASPLCDVARVARALEAAYRRMWQHWCERQGDVPAEPGEKG